MKLLQTFGGDSQVQHFVDVTWQESEIGQFNVFNHKLLWCFFEAWQTAGDLATAYGIGRAESSAAFNLLNAIDPAVVFQLTEYVKFLEAILSFAWDMITGFR